MVYLYYNFIHQLYLNKAEKECEHPEQCTNEYYSTSSGLDKYCCNELMNSLEKN